MMTRKQLPPIEYIRTILDYDPITGEFTYKKPGIHKTWPTLEIKMNGVRDRYWAHRVAWLFVYGEPIPDIIDHADRNIRNNVISNLRAATHSQNMANSKMRNVNTTGVKGVVLLPSGKYVAKINVNRQRVDLGHYDTIEEAARVRRAWEQRVYGEFSPIS